MLSLLPSLPADYSRHLLQSLVGGCCGSALRTMLLVMLAVMHLLSSASDVCRWLLGFHTSRRPITC